MFRKNVSRGHLAEILGIVPGVVVPQDYLQKTVSYVERVHADTLAALEEYRLADEIFGNEGLGDRRNVRNLDSFRTLERRRQVMTVFRLLGMQSRTCQPGNRATRCKREEYFHLL